VPSAPASKGLAWRESTRPPQAVTTADEMKVTRTNVRFKCSVSVLWEDRLRAKQKSSETGGSQVNGNVSEEAN
jgi:hypothetical protein